MLIRCVLGELGVEFRIDRSVSAPLSSSIVYSLTAVAQLRASRSDSPLKVKLECLESSALGPGGMGGEFWLWN